MASCCAVHGSVYPSLSLEQSNHMKCRPYFCFALVFVVSPLHRHNFGQNTVLTWKQGTSRCNDAHTDERVVLLVQWTVRIRRVQWSNVDLR